MNEMFQEYKRKVDYGIAVAQITTQRIQKAELIEFEEPEEVIEIPAYETTPEEQKAFEEYKRKRNQKIFEKFGTNYKSSNPMRNYRDGIFMAMLHEMTTYKTNSKQEALYKEGLLDDFVRIIANYDLIIETIKTDSRFKGANIDLRKGGNER